MITQLKALKFGFAAFLSLLALEALAVPLTYDEAVDGDITSGVTNFLLDFGVNTVTGTVFNLTTSDFDKFDALLPTGGILQSVGLNLSQGTGGNGSFADFFEVYDKDDHFNPLVSANVSSGGNFSWVLNAAVSGLYFTGLNSFPAGMVNDYTITLNLARATVPRTLHTRPDEPWADWCGCG